MVAFLLNACINMKVWKNIEISLADFSILLPSCRDISLGPFKVKVMDGAQLFSTSIGDKQHNHKMLFFF